MRPVTTLLLFALLSFAGCEPKFRQCPTTHTDPIKQLYNDVLIEIIEKQLGRGYLPDEDRKFVWRHFQEVYAGNWPNEPSHHDSVWLHNQEAIFHNRLFQDSARFKTYYLNTSSQSIYQIADLPNRFSAYAPGSRIGNWIKAIAPQQEQAALDSLNSVQNSIQPDNFQLCTARILSYEEHRPYRPEKGVGVLTISKIVFSKTQNQALLAYGWHCGSKCGYGEVLFVEKLGGRWHIKQAIGTWIS
ncbi:hypothetical protein FY528_13580 [Hymenobacter lutimineralis]|uniref:Uncharacterized protein n=1 Tax=Hymenobacter lutimineralis TaxID=2606448 RepID=A0A5D6UX42_9BACT|nr:MULTISPECIES: hypothetical protein [Hymenobacter]QIX63280.1 hypothetical protein HER32_19720 [Hymenobacter sp. BT18]TYZ08073.1 hypothetical protein FY528_13580 [Hymenobacter lutimineralis]